MEYHSHVCMRTCLFPVLWSQHRYCRPSRSNKLQARRQNLHAPVSPKDAHRNDARAFRRHNAAVLNRWDFSKFDWRVFLLTFYFSALVERILSAMAPLWRSRCAGSSCSIQDICLETCFCGCHSWSNFRKSKRHTRQTKTGFSKTMLRVLDMVQTQTIHWSIHKLNNIFTSKHEFPYTPCS
jgi:hypothetical protein